MKFKELIFEAAEMRRYLNDTRQYQAVLNDAAEFLLKTRWDNRGAVESFANLVSAIRAIKNHDDRERHWSAYEEIIDRYWRARYGVE